MNVPEGQRARRQREEVVPCRMASTSSGCCHSFAQQVSCTIRSVEVRTVAPIAAVPSMPQPAVMMPQPAVMMPQPAVVVPQPAVVVPQPAMMVPQPAVVVPMMPPDEGHDLNDSENDMSASSSRSSSGDSEFLAMWGPMAFGEIDEEAEQEVDEHDHDEV